MLGVFSLLFTRDWHSHIMEQQEEELEETKGDEELNTPPRPNSVHGVGIAAEHLHLHVFILRIYLHILVSFLSTSMCQGLKKRLFKPNSRSTLNFFYDLVLAFSVVSHAVARPGQWPRKSVMLRANVSIYLQWNVAMYRNRLYGYCRRTVPHC